MKREFLHVDDMARASCFVMNRPKATFSKVVKPTLSHVNVGFGEDVSIAELATLIAKIVGFTGDIIFDTSKPDGPPRKLLDISLLKAMGWNPRINLYEGLKSTYAWFIENSTVRD